MPFSQFLLLKVPSFLLCFIVVGGVTLLSVVGLLAVRSLVPYSRLKVHNDVAAAIYGTLGMMYAVLVGFVVVIVWEGFDRSSLNVEKEANCLVDLYRDAQAFPPALRQQVRSIAREYAKVVTDKEWDMLKKGQESPGAAEELNKMWVLYSGYQPETVTERVFFEESVRKLNEIGELRAVRLSDAKTGIHPLLWFVLIVGGISTIVFVFLFGSENLAAQLVMTVLLGVLISLILFTILSLDFPFTGDISISAQPFKQVLVLASPA